MNCIFCNSELIFLKDDLMIYYTCPSCTNIEYTFFNNEIDCIILESNFNNFTFKVYLMYNNNRIFIDKYSKNTYIGSIKTNLTRLNCNITPQNITKKLKTILTFL
ncbi:hypothetical protein UFOVP1290_139 [uncultured Caudovirales phage]|uniref:Uncharacterized protein n=1 Tax=uncultured Caudovirales phage TaxID=2100421 RepID=A0A6J5RHY3_9CAUD|nr:hypothetical protein UFOVP1290_139 [uncultured Caudovirales phage]